jgi:hypothetical protein
MDTSKLLSKPWLSYLTVSEGRIDPRVISMIPNNRRAMQAAEKT